MQCKHGNDYRSCSTCEAESGAWRAYVEANPPPSYVYGSREYSDQTRAWRAAGDAAVAAAALQPPEAAIADDFGWGRALAAARGNGNAATPVVAGARPGDDDRHDRRPRANAQPTVTAAEASAGWDRAFAAARVALSRK